MIPFHLSKPPKKSNLFSAQNKIMERFSSDFSTSPESIIELPPGFRFHPTDEELITHYLSPKVLNSSFSTKVIVDADLNKVEPWDLPWKANMGEKEWYFFCLRDRKYPTGLRTNRATEAGYWKATGKDREIFRGKALVGMKKTLVFYQGRAPKGIKTNWVMHEYRLEGKCSIQNLPNKAKNEWGISRVFKKSSGGKKIHISCLRPGVSYEPQSVHLPSLMDMSINDREISGHVTCFSNSMEDCHVDNFTASAKNSTILPQLNPSTGILQPCPDLHDLRMLLSTSNPFMRQDVDGSSSYGGLDYSGLKVYEDDQDYTGQVDLDCLWNY